MAAQAMKGGLEILKPLLASGQGRSKGTVVIGTVKGDLHDIGKNLVTMMMESAGFEVVDMGVDVDSETAQLTVGRQSQIVFNQTEFAPTISDTLYTAGNGAGGYSDGTMGANGGGRRCSWKR